MWIVRPVDNLNAAQSYGHFAEFCLAGILCCEFRKPRISILAHPAVLAGVGIVVLAKPASGKIRARKRGPKGPFKSLR